MSRSLLGLLAWFIFGALFVQVHSANAQTIWNDKADYKIKTQNVAPQQKPAPNITASKPMQKNTPAWYNNTQNFFGSNESPALASPVNPSAQIAPTQTGAVAAPRIPVNQSSLAAPVVAEQKSAPLFSPPKFSEPKFSDSQPQRPIANNNHPSLFGELVPPTGAMPQIAQPVAQPVQPLPAQMTQPVTTPVLALPAPASSPRFQAEAPRAIAKPEPVLNSFPNLASVPLQAPAPQSDAGWTQKLQADHQKAQQTIQQTEWQPSAKDQSGNFQEFPMVAPIATIAPPSNNTALQEPVRQLQPVAQTADSYVSAKPAARALESETPVAAATDTQNWPKTPIYVMDSGDTIASAPTPMASSPQLNYANTAPINPPRDLPRRDLSVASDFAPPSMVSNQPQNMAALNEPIPYLNPEDLSISMPPLTPPVGNMPNTGANNFYAMPLQAPANAMQQPMNYMDVPASAWVPPATAMNAPIGNNFGWNDMMAPPLVPPTSSPVFNAQPQPPVSMLPWQDPSNGAIRSYNERMQQNAPFTTSSGAPYYPYGYSGFGNWNNTQPSFGASNGYRTKIASAGSSFPVTPSAHPAGLNSININKPIATLYFRDDGSNLGGNEQKVLQELVDWYEGKGGGLRVVGHSSARTPDMDPAKQKMRNYKLSLDRAETVSKRLQKMGVKKDRLLVTARGDTDKAYAESMPNGEAWNRRVEIYWDMF